MVSICQKASFIHFNNLTDLLNVLFNFTSSLDLGGHMVAISTDSQLGLPSAVRSRVGRLRFVHSFTLSSQFMCCIMLLKSSDKLLK